jgi:hypothetical protein
MNETQNKGDKPSKEVRAGILGGTKANISELFKWTGDHKPNLIWLTEPLKNETGDKVAKHSCTGCGMEGEASLAHLERLFKLAEKEEDLKKIDWKNHFLQSTACGFCIEDAPEGTSMALVIGELPKE